MDRHLVREVRPLGRQPGHRGQPHQVLEAAGADAGANHAHLFVRGRPLHSGPGRAGRHRRPDDLAVRHRRRRHRRSLAAHRSMELVGLSGRTVRGLGGLSPGHGPRPEHLRAQGRRRQRREQLQHRVLRIDRQPVPPAGRGGQPGVPLLSDAHICGRGADHGRQPQRAGLRGASGGDPRPRLAQAQGRRRVPAHWRPGGLRRNQHHVQGRRRHDPIRVRARTSSWASTPRKERSGRSIRPATSTPRAASREPASAGSSTSRTAARGIR